MEEKGETPGRIVLNERYPNRLIAADFARADGVSERAVSNVLSWSLKEEADPFPRDWLEDMRAEDRRLRREDENTPAERTAAERDDAERMEKLRREHEKRFSKKTTSKKKRQPH